MKRRIFDQFSDCPDGFTYEDVPTRTLLILNLISIACTALSRWASVMVSSFPLMYVRRGSAILPLKERLLGRLSQKVHIIRTW